MLMIMILMMEMSRLFTIDYGEWIVILRDS